MARYTGPTTKIARRFREPIFGPDKVLEKRNYPPGQHGPNKRRAKQSEYAVQLAEKQKAKYTYGILEKQFENLYLKASAKPGVTGEILLSYCEARLDNVVFRLGIAPTRSGARQLVSHRHIMVNGNVVNVSSFQVRPGDRIAVRPKSKSLQAITLSLGNRKNYEWLDWNGGDMQGVFLAYPQRTQIPENIKEQLIVELYSK
ncbi:MAG: ribosomal protein [Bacteroidota bacterium]|jgi:small subunit ribosomal protein S4